MKRTLYSLAFVCAASLALFGQGQNFPGVQAFSAGTLTQAYGLGISSGGQLIASPFQVDALTFDATPAAPTTPCQDFISAELSTVNGNTAVPDNGIGLTQGTPVLIPYNCFATAKNGPIYLPSGTWELQSSQIIPSTTTGNTGPSNLIGTGHSGNCGQNGKCATSWMYQIGMSYAQMGNVTVTNANPPTVAPSPTACSGGSCFGTATRMGPIFNTAWVGLNFIEYNITTGVATTALITAVTSTPLNGIPCGNTCQLTLSGTSWSGPTTDASYFLGFPGTVSVSGTTVTGAGTSFNSAWVGTTFQAGLTGNGPTNGGLCGGAVCTITAVASATSMTLSGTWSGSGSAGLNYTLGTVYGPMFSFGQASNPVTQGSSLGNMTIDGNAQTTGGGAIGMQDGTSCIDMFFPQELGQVWKTKLQNCSDAALDMGGGGFYNELGNAGPVSDFEITMGVNGSAAILPVAGTVASVSNGPLVGAGTVYPVQGAYATYVFSVAPVPSPARGQIATCTGITNGAAGTVYNVNARVIDQITPLQVLVFIPTTHANDSVTSTGSCYFYPSQVMTGNHPFYRNRGITNITVNPGTGGTAFQYTANKTSGAYDGAAASANLPVAFEFGGGSGCTGANLFAQQSDIGYAYGEVGALRGCNYFGVASGTGAGTTAHYISSQFGVGPVNWLGMLGTSGFGTVPTNTLVDNCNSNTYPYGTNGNGNPDIGIYFMDRNCFPITNAIIAATTPATVTNALTLNGVDGIDFRVGSTTPVFKVNNAGLIQGTNTQIVTADVTGIVTTTPGVGEFQFTNLVANRNYGFHCDLMYQQATAAGGVGFSVSGATNAPTRIDAWADIYSNATGTLVGSAVANLTTTTATPFTAATPSAINTTFEAKIWGVIQEGASVSKLTILVFTGAGADAVTLKAGSKCSVEP